MAKVRKKADRYFLDYYDHEGKRQRPTMPKGTTKKAAQKKLREIEVTSQKVCGSNKKL